MFLHQYGILLRPHQRRISGSLFNNSRILTKDSVGGLWVLNDLLRPTKPILIIMMYWTIRIFYQRPWCNGLDVWSWSSKGINNVSFSLLKVMFGSIEKNWIFLRLSLKGTYWFVLSVLLWMIFLFRSLRNLMNVTFPIIRIWLLIKRYWTSHLLIPSLKIIRFYLPIIMILLSSLS